MIHRYLLKMTLLLFSLPLAAQWSTDSAQNTPISVGSEDRNEISSVNSGDDGLILTWRDGRNGGSSNYDIYIQKLDRMGNALWTAGGQALCSAIGSQLNPAAVPDEHGGAIIAWEDGRTVNNLDIYAQRIGASGSGRWTADGIAVCIASGVQRNPSSVSDGEGGAIIAWEDYRAGGSERDIYAQRVDSLGSLLWTTNGIPVCTVAGRQIMPQVVPDGAGGAIIVWGDQRVSGSSDIYAQRISAAGVILWSAEGLAVSTAAEFQESHTVAADGSGGVLVSWIDFRNDPTQSTPDIYAQKISSGGTVEWQADGVPVCLATGSQYSVSLVSDGAGGAIIAWDDNRLTRLNVYLQRITAQGQAMWTVDGVQLSELDVGQDQPLVISDGVGGAIVTWEDRRNNNTDLFAQRVDPAGNFIWTEDGVAISTANAAQGSASVISDQHGGAYLAWEDRRAGSNGDDAYAQQVNANGEIGVTVTGIESGNPLPDGFVLEQNYPNPFNPGTTIRYSLPKSGFVTLRVYDVLGQLLRTLVDGKQSAGSHTAVWDGRDATGQQVGSGIYYYRMTTIAGHQLSRSMLLLR